MFDFVSPSGIVLNVCVQVSRLSVEADEEIRETSSTTDKPGNTHVVHNFSSPSQPSISLHIFHLYSHNPLCVLLCCLLISQRITACAVLSRLVNFSFFFFSYLRIFLADITFTLVDPTHPLANLFRVDIGSRQVLLFIDSGVLLLLSALIKSKKKKKEEEKSVCECVTAHICSESEREIAREGEKFIS